MIRKTFMRTGLFLSALILFYSSSYGQIKDFDVLKSLPSDAVKYLEAYMEPWTNAFGAGLNGGWYNTAKPHSPLGFDITTSFNVGIVPTSAQEFDISSLGLTSLTGSGKAPTVAGPDEGPRPSLVYRAGGRDLETITTPPGTNWRYVPVPTFQLGIGLPLGTEVKGRLIPRLNIKDGSLSLWGLGVMHSLTQYLPGDKLLPFDVSLFGGYTKLDGKVPLSILPSNSYPQNYSPAVSFDNQSLDVTITGLNLSAVASLNLPVITLYGGLGYSKTKTEMALTGNFPTPSWNETEERIEYNNNGIHTSTAFPAMDIENFSGLRANIGLRIKIAVITIHADYTKAQYNVLSAGLGVTFR